MKKIEHIGASLINFLSIYQDDSTEGPLLLLLTMRNRKQLYDKMIRKCYNKHSGYKISRDNEQMNLNVKVSNIKFPDEFYRLKSFLDHLNKQQQNIFLVDEASKALYASDKYSKYPAYAGIFQIERVRRIRSKSAPNNNNLNYCMRILDSLETLPFESTDEGDYEAIYVPFKALEGLINLQKGLCYARSASYEKTLKFAEKTRGNFEMLADGENFQHLKIIFVWWTVVLEEQVYSRCYMWDKVKQLKNKAKQLRIKISQSKKDYLKNIRPEYNPEEQTHSKIFEKVVANNDELQDSSIEINTFLHAHHLILAEFLLNREEFDIKKKFDKHKIFELFKTTENDISRYKQYKSAINQTLLNGIAGKGRSNLNLRLQPLLFDHTTLKSDKLVDRMKTNNATTLSIIQIAKERNNTYLILQLTLIAIDYLVKSQRLLQIYLRREEVRKRKGKKSEREIDKQQVNYHSNMIKLIFKDITETMESKLLETEFKTCELMEWVSHIGDVLREIDCENPKKYLETLNQKCKQAATGATDESMIGLIKLNYLGDNSKIPLDFYASHNNDEWTPYSTGPGESKFVGR